MGLSRRAALTLGLIGGGYILLQWRGADTLERLTGLPDLFELESPKGFRQMAGGSSSGGSFDPFLGLGTDETTPRQPLMGADLCRALFGAYDTTDAVPIAYFSDYNCPYCRVLGNDLRALETQMPDRVRVIWHELPLLGPTSVLGARAALAAKKQGAYKAFHARLNTGIVRINEAYIDQIADELKLDTSRLRADMDADSITQMLTRSKRVADAFAVIGTPFMVVGRTAVIGRISPTRLRQLVDLERAEGQSASCG